MCIRDRAKYQKRARRIISKSMTLTGKPITYLESAYKAYYQNVKKKSRKVRHLQKNKLHIWNQRIKLIICKVVLRFKTNEYPRVDRIDTRSRGLSASRWTTGETSSPLLYTSDAADERSSVDLGGR